MRTLFILITLLLIRSVSVPGHAQGQTLDERDFWAQLDQTAILLQQAIAAPATRADSITALNQQWGNVSAIRLQNGTIIPINTLWLRPSPAADTAALQTLLDRVQAVQAYYAAYTANPDAAENPLLALERVLAQERFQYGPEATPTPLPDDLNREQGNISQNPSLIGDTLATLVLAATIVTGIILLGMYVLRGLRGQPALLRLPRNHADDPETTEEARDRATQSEAVGDYRNAVRYLYLATLLLLDERGLIHYDATLTNREHVRTIRDNADLSEHFGPVVTVFDNVWYGFKPISPEEYATFRAEVDALHALEVTPNA